MTLTHATPPEEYRGHCRRCDREHRFENDVPLAVSALRQLFEHLQRDDAVREALEASRGKMVGVLVAESATGVRHVLRAYSGELAGRRDWPQWVGPVMRREDTAQLETATLANIAALDAQIALCDVDRAQHALTDAREAARLDAAERRRTYRRERFGEDGGTIAAAAARQKQAHGVRVSGAVRIEAARQGLLAERKKLRALRDARRDVSRVLSTAFFDNATITNARGERWPLRDVFVGAGIAGGTTDCTVPKLLEAANVARLRPVALVEAWWGTTINGRHHGDVQEPCERRCKPILGHLLCGLEDARGHS